MNSSNFLGHVTGLWSSSVLCLEKNQESKFSLKKELGRIFDVARVIKARVR